MILDILDVATYATNVATGESQHVSYVAIDNSLVETFIAYVTTSGISYSNIDTEIKKEQQITHWGISK